MPKKGNENRERLIEIQRATFEENRKRIAQYEQVITPDFVDYEAEYNEEVRGYTRVTSTGKLLDSLRKAPCFLVGDYHTFSISQKSFLKILKRIRRKKMIVGLELFESTSQEFLDAYVLKGGSERTLLRKSRLISQWPYAVWEKFKPILDLARSRGWRVLGLDAPHEWSATLRERDRHMARMLIEGLKQAPEGSYSAILVGELHVSSGHLPREIVEAGQGANHPMEPPVSVFQNPGPIYWQLVDEKVEQEAEVVQLSPSQFALNSAPPMVVQQSYLNWIDYGDTMMEYDHLSYHFRETANGIQKALGLRSNGMLEDVEVFGPGDYSYLDAVRTNRDAVIQSEPVTFEQEAEDSRVFIEPNVVYLGNLNLHHVGEVAGRYLHTLTAGLNQNHPLSFYGEVLHNAFAMLASKIVNPKRKAHQLPYFRQLLKSVGTADKVSRLELEVASSVLVHKNYENGRRSRAFHKLGTGSPEKRNLLVRELGFLLGEKMYYAFARGNLSRAEVKIALYTPLRDPNVCAALYFSLARQVDRERIPARM